MSPRPRRAREVPHSHEPLLPKSERGTYIALAAGAVGYVVLLALLLLMGLSR